jgi:SpoVK/Ycf46/Vps4 family AAA+-type ATPase
VGESDKLVHAIFSLAQKIAPTVIFIDEIDTLLKKRESMNTSNSVHSTMLGSLMSEWDGISNDNKTPVIVLGATNRPADIDSAFLRRMPFQIKTLAPDLTSRVDILKKMIYFNKYSVDSSVDLVQLAVELEGYTGSDIKELLRVACVHRMKNIIKDVKSRMNNDDQQTQQSTAVSGNKASTFQEPMIINSTVLNSKPLTAMDFQYALEKAVRDGM